MPVSVSPKPSTIRSPKRFGDEACEPQVQPDELALGRTQRSDGHFSGGKRIGLGQEIDPSTDVAANVVLKLVGGPVDGPRQGLDGIPAAVDGTEVEEQFRLPLRGAHQIVGERPGLGIVEMSA